MAFFSPKTWKQRIVEFPGRRRLDDTSTADVYDVSRAEGNVMQEGDGFTAANMNDLEQRINNAVNDVAGLSADEYDPNATYSSGDLRIHDNILHKANQDISVAEPWTPAHWDATTLAAELSSLNSSIQFTDYAVNISTPSGNGYSSGAVEVNPFPSAERVIVIGGRKSQSNSVCNATMEKYADSYVMYATAPESGEHKVTFIGFYSPIVRILSE